MGDYFRILEKICDSIQLMAGEMSSQYESSGFFPSRFFLEFLRKFSVLATVFGLATM